MAKSASRLQEEPVKPHRSQRRTGVKLVIALGALIVLIVAVRLALDPIAAYETRKSLNNLEGFQGDFDRVHVTVFGPGYDITHLKLMETDEKGEITKTKASAKDPVFYVKRAHLGVDWRQLLHLRLVANLRLDEPKIVLSRPAAAQAKPTKAPPDISKQLEKMAPLRVERVGVLDGQILFRETGSGAAQPEVWIHDLAATAQNLGTRRKLIKGRPATVSARGIIGRSGELKLFVSADPLASPLAFAGQASIVGLRAAELYQFIAPKTDVQADQGTVDVFASFESKDGAITGGVKPVLKNIEIQPADQGLWDKAKAWLLDKSIAIASDRVPGRNAVATTVPIKGRLIAPDVQLWPAILGVIRNAFVQGLASGFANLPPATAPQKESILKQAKDALKKGEGPPHAQPLKEHK